MQCGKLVGCDAEIAGECDFDSHGNWDVKLSPEDDPAIPFPLPPEPPETEPNAQACCENTATAEQTKDGCEADVARGACNRAIALMQAKIDEVKNNPPVGCDSNCVERATKGLETWISDLEANFDDCVDKALDGQPIHLPNPDTESGTGALACGTLTIDFSLTEDAVDLEESCSTSFNPSSQQDGMMLQCSLDGDITLDGPQGTAVSTFTGTAVVRYESACSTSPCWFSIESLELDAARFSQSGYVGHDVHASLAYVGFGIFDDSTGDGTIAQRMFGLDVAMVGDTPSSSPGNYAFSMGNSDAAAFEISSSQFQIVDAYFAWQDYDLVLTSDPATCTCLNCT